jgi:DNA polymerase-4
LKDIGDYEQILGVLLGQVDEVAGRLRGNFVEGRTITLKIRYGDFRTITRSRTLDESTDVTDTLWRAAKAVFDEWYKSRRGKLRLIGFGVSQLNAAGKGQKGLFGEQDEKKHKDIDKAVDEIKRRFGKGAIKRKL